MIRWRRSKRMEIESAVKQFALLEVNKIKVDFNGVCYQMVISNINIIQNASTVLYNTVQRYILNI